MTEIAEKISISIKNEERFYLPNFLLISFVHILALYGLTTLSAESLGAWICAHLYFSIFGISLGYHRYFSHKSYIPTAPIRFLLGLSSTLCLQGGPIYWAAVHRAHHTFTDKLGDPHSAVRGFFWSHMKWLFYRSPNGFSYRKNKTLVNDLIKHKEIEFLDRFQLIVNLSVLVIAFVGFKNINRLDLFMAVFPLRIVSVWHATWLINSYTHSAKFFDKNFNKDLNLRNSKIVSLILGGEGYHSDHHKYPSILFPANPFLCFDLAAPFLYAMRAVKLVDFHRKFSVQDYEKINQKEN